MNCPHCGSRMEKGWAYCPACGFRAERSFFEDIVSRIKREFRDFREISNAEKQVEAFDLSPFFKKPRGSGFSIRIYQAGGSPPQVSVKTFGGVDREKIEQAVYSHLGMKEAGVRELRKRAKEIQREETTASAPLKYAEEPRTEVKRAGDRVAVDIHLPSVKSLGQVSIQELENSVEVKAVVGDRAFFKILTKPPQFRLAQKSFSGSVLHLEFA